MEQIRAMIASNNTLPTICKSLTSKFVDLGDTSKGMGSPGCDNITLLIVAFLHGKTSEQWYNQIKEDYNNERRQIMAVILDL